MLIMKLTSERQQGSVTELRAGCGGHMKIKFHAAEVQEKSPERAG